MSFKRRKIKIFSVEGFDNAHYYTTEQYAHLVASLYNKATAEIASVAAKENYDPDKPFSFSDYPKTLSKVQETVRKLSENIEAVIKKGSRKQWLFANQKNDEFISSIMNTSKLSKERLGKYQDRNLDALKAFQERKIDGMNLSQRVWKYTKQYRDQIETGLDVGLGEGRSAAQLSRDLRQNLQNPDALFRRVRDKRGNLVLSKAAKAFHPGQGVYRSAYKNAMRLTRSEINMSYRESDWRRWQSLDFIVGFEIRRSNHEPKCSCKLCERLVGKYPKTFKFKGWHPQCLCYAIPIIQDRESYKKQEEEDLRSALYGTPKAKIETSNKVVDFPNEFKAWISENVEAQKNWRSTPYFVRDNFKGGLLSEGLKYVRESTRPMGSEDSVLRGGQDLAVVQAMKQAEKVALTFERVVKDIAYRMGASVTPVNLKGYESTMRKLRSENIEIENVRDLLRTTIIVKAEKDVDKIVQKVKDSFVIPTNKYGRMLIKEQSTSLGYRGWLINVLVDGVVAEIQINTPQMIYAKSEESKKLLDHKTFETIRLKSGLKHGLGHKYYEEWRDANTKDIRRTELERISSMYYQRIRRVKL